MQQTHNIQQSCVRLHGLDNEPLLGSNTSNTPFRRFLTNFWKDGFFYLRKPFTPNCANSVTDCGSVFLSKTCTLPRIPCKRKADPCKFLSVQNSVICMKFEIGHFRYSLRPRRHRHECFSLFTFLRWQLLRYEQFFCFEMISSRCKPYTCKFYFCHRKS